MHVLQLVNNERAPFFRKQLDALERAGIECTTLSVPGRHTTEESRSPLDYLRFHGPVRRHARREYDLIHANYGLTAPAALAQFRLPVVLSLWGSDLAGAVGALSRACSRLADETVVMSERMAADLPVEAHVVPHCVDTDQFRPRPREEARAEAGWDDGARHVLFPYSPDRPVKDYPRAERVVDRARERIDDPVELQVVSGVSHEEMVTYMNAADALLLTSRREGSPNSVKEALACNLPVVATDVGDVYERLAGVSPSAVGTTDADLVDGLVDVLEDGRRANGRQAVASLTLSALAERLRAVYARAMDREVTADAAPATA